jgi:hypothetical protein
MLFCNGIGEDGLLPCGAPARNLCGLAAISEGNGKVEGGGGPELFVGVAGASSYAGNEGD